LRCRPGCIALSLSICFFSYRTRTVGHYYWPLFIARLNSDISIDFGQISKGFILPSPKLIINYFNVDINRSFFDTVSFLDSCVSNHLFLVLFSNTHHTAHSHSCTDPHCLMSDRFLLKSFHQYPLFFVSMPA